jgi:predicted acetyltransferase
VAIEIRNPSDEELRDAMRAGEAAFGAEHKEEERERHRKMLPLDRFLAAYDDGRPVGTAASFPFELTIPGGVVRAAGVTWVGVLPSHRRRGILRGFMREQLEDIRNRGEPLAILWASETGIYGRFGYGLAALNGMLDARTDRFAFRDDPGPAGTIKLVSRDEALELFPPVYDRIRLEVPGMVARSRDWWAEYKLADPEQWRDGAGPKFYAALALDGSVEGFALYRIKEDWRQALPQSQLRVLEALATSATATREVWRFLFGIDLVTKVEQEHFDPSSPLFLMVEDPRRLHLQLYDGLWLRFVDLEASLRARSYATDDSIVIEIRDELCAWNEGRWRIGRSVERTDDDPELELDVRDLASVYLGAFDFHWLARAQRVRELRPGALERATLLFRTSRPPFCPEDF